MVNPSQFNVQADSEVPIVLAYNLSHYESMEPCTRGDTLSTVRLVKEYEEGRYRFGKKDILSLITITECQGREHHTKDTDGRNQKKDTYVKETEEIANPFKDPTTARKVNDDNEMRLKSKLNLCNRPLSFLSKTILSAFIVSDGGKYLSADCFMN